MCFGRPRSRVSWTQREREKERDRERERERYRRHVFRAPETVECPFEETSWGDLEPTVHNLIVWKRKVTRTTKVTLRCKVILS